MYVFLFHLSPENGFPRLKIPGISSYGHFAVITWLVNLDMNKMAEYKSISTHLYNWPTRHSKTIHPRAFRLSICSTHFSVVSCCFFSHNGARIKIDFCSVHVRTVTWNVTWWPHNVMWRFRKNKHDIFRLTPVQTG